MSPGEALSMSSQADSMWEGSLCWIVWFSTFLSLKRRVCQWIRFMGLTHVNQTHKKQMYKPDCHLLICNGEAIMKVVQRSNYSSEGCILSTRLNYS